MRSPLPAGLYDRVLTEELELRLKALDAALSPELASLASPQIAPRLGAHFGQLLEHALSRLNALDVPVTKQVDVVNALIQHLREHLIHLGATDAGEVVHEIRDRVLVALLRTDPITGPIALPRPSLPLAETHLLINARDELQVGHELSLELESADRVDLLCSFLLWSGFKRLEPALRGALARPSTRMRVLTTVYMGATEPRVLDELHALGAEIRVSYDTHRTRLHAKAWLLHRETGSGTAYVGSSNLSSAALTDGLEWNVRIGMNSPLVLEKFRSAFETYWNDPAFESYHPGRDGRRIREALNLERAPSGAATWQFDLRPRPFQDAILEALDVERTVHGRFRNLLVAATGTGKTVVAAFDYARLAEQLRAASGLRPTLLFVAHRRELLAQAQATFRTVLKDAYFGELLVDGARPSTSDHLFASVQSLSRIAVETVAPDRWDVVIVDEFHHAEAPSYERWLRHLRPRVLLGMTATPERSDGLDVRDWFGGLAAIELRLWDAIEQGLLAPFQYFGLKDPIELSSYWKRGQLDLGALDSVLTGHHARALEVIRAVRDFVARPESMKAIGFCVGRGHAEFMARYFSENGLKSKTALGGDSEREETIRRLRAGELQAVFTVDALSEGVDIPEVDTALMLRPTESATVFVQQLGRGLRLAPGKRCLTVIDLVATPDRTFRLDQKYLALTNSTRRDLERQISLNFPLLPAGCSILLRRDAKEEVLRSLREALSSGRKSLIAAIARLKSSGKAATLTEVMNETGLTVGEIYRRRSLTELRREAGYDIGPAGPSEGELSRGIARLTSLDDPAMLASIATDCRRLAPPPATLYWDIVLATLVPDRKATPVDVLLAAFWQHTSLVRELGELAEQLLSQGEFVPIPFLNGQHGLQIHCHYRQEQILAALTAGSAKRVYRSQAGVLPVQDGSMDALFVTVSKSPDRYSPSTMYEDYPMSQERFHWQSMSSTTPDSKRGRRHVHHQAEGVIPLLFVRKSPEDEFGETAPYLFLGPVQCESHEGSRPISIVWRLESRMPASFFERTRVVA